VIVLQQEKYDPKAFEAEILKFWLDKKIPDKIVGFDAKRDKFYLLDGPPYVNGVPHAGHVKTTVAKDIWSKFMTMQGFSVWYQPGFDCGGLPIENAVEKKLGVKSKKDIEKIGIDRFFEECKKLAEGNKSIWLDMYKKLGAWRGWLDPYMTYKNYYLESGWWTVKQMYDRGLMVQGEKPLFWCPHCQTTLSGYEVTDSYADVTDYSIYVKYPLAGEEKTFIIIWTTTPWTLPSNVAIAVHPEETYVKVLVGDEKYILAEKRLEEAMKEMGIEKYTVLDKFPGSKLDHMKYEPVLDIPIQNELRKEKNGHIIILSIPLFRKGISGKVLAKKGVSVDGSDIKAGMEHMVTMDTGSGCVHCAPGHGEEDYNIGVHYELPKPSPVDEEGKLMKETGIFAGLFVKDADPVMIDHLKKTGYLIKDIQITHSYPLCWRCKTPLIFRLSKQWFFRVEPIKSRMLEENEKVVWLPDFARSRFDKWLENATDWAVSMQRYWGIPMPIWICKNGHIEVIGSRKELREKATKELPEDLDLHKNVVDKVKIKCAHCKEEMDRVRDTMNVWFDSGISPWASLGYPFQNKEVFEKLWPVDLISESQDQIRGWFYSLMFCGVGSFDATPYRTVAMTGWTLDDKGEKMSKSLGNVVYAEDAMNTLGSDALRFYYCWNTAPWETQNFSLVSAKELRKTMDILWNCCMFAKNYSDHKLLEEKVSSADLKVEDIWIISRVNSLAKSVTQDLENFKLHFVGRSISDFIMNDFSRWYIKIIRDRVSPWYTGADKKSAQFTMLYVFEVLTRLMAPITPFISEKIYRTLYPGKQPESIHLAAWPKHDEKLINEDLEMKMKVADQLIEAVNSLKQVSDIKLRWPLAQIYVKPDGDFEKAAVEQLAGIVKSLANVKEVNVVAKLPKMAARKFEGGEVVLGNVLKDEAMLREFMRRVQVMRKENKLNVNEKINLWLKGDQNVQNILKGFQSELRSGVGAESIYFDALKGKSKGTLDFDGKKIEIYFEKA
jgi:isoleucyl-tRNA synthetase